MMARIYVLIISLLTLLVGCAGGENDEGNEDDVMSQDLPGFPGNKKTGWSGSGTLHTGSTTDQISVQANFPEPAAYVIEFTKKNNVLTNLPIKSEAYITWSVEGNSVTRRVSIGNGTTIQGVAQAVKIVVTDATVASISNPVTPNGSAYDVQIQVTKGTRGSTSYPPVLQPPGYYNVAIAKPVPVDSSTTVSFPIPQDAGVTSLNIQSVGFDGGGNFFPIKQGDLYIAVLQNNLVIARYEYPGPGQFVPVIPGADTVSVSYSNSFDTTGAAVISFTALFGIDG